MKAINLNVLNVLKQLNLITRIYCEKSKYKQRNYYTCLVSSVNANHFALLRNLLKNNSDIKSIIIKDKDYIRISVYLKNDNMLSRQQYLLKEYTHVSNSKYALKRITNLN